MAARTKRAIACMCMHGFGSNFVCKLIGLICNFFVFLTNWIKHSIFDFGGVEQFVTKGRREEEGKKGRREEEQNTILRLDIF